MCIPSWGQICCLLVLWVQPEGFLVMRIGFSGSVLVSRLQDRQVGAS